MADLVYRKDCQHGEPGHCIRKNPDCPGGSEIVLDADKVLMRGREIERPDVGKTLMHVTVADVLAALEETQ